jgi:protein O-GlcNAc transferase
VGYLSPDFREHSTGYFVEGLLAGHDRGAVEVFCYSSGRAADGVTARLKEHFACFRNVVGMSDRSAAELIRRDGIDVLVDLAGHTGENRLLILAYKAAPVQVTYLGYPNTTGMTAIAYRLTDALADPPGEGVERYSEKLVRLPGSFLCYRPVEDAPEAGEPPAARQGSVTFGCFNAQAKINLPLVEQWSRILRRVARSSLIVKNASLADGATRDRLAGMFGVCGVGVERLELLGRTATPAQHLAVYRRVDIALDTFPYHGTTTTCEALWMGVPVVTLAGAVHRSRVGVSLLRSVGLPELVAGSWDEYVEIAAGLAGDRGRLVELRAGMRERMRESRLMDGAGLAREVEGAYRDMWRRWCEVGRVGE